MGTTLPFPAQSWTRMFKQYSMCKGGGGDDNYLASIIFQDLLEESFLRLYEP
jgi:hypothetical protein